MSTKRNASHSETTLGITTSIIWGVLAAAVSAVLVFGFAAWAFETLDPDARPACETTSTTACVGPVPLPDCAPDVTTACVVPESAGGGWQNRRPSSHSETVPPCITEDAAGPCAWDAAARGNGQGRSFTVDADGVRTYWGE